MPTSHEVASVAHCHTALQAFQSVLSALSPPPDPALDADQPVHANAYHCLLHVLGVPLEAAAPVSQHAPVVWQPRASVPCAPSPVRAVLLQQAQRALTTFSM